MGHERVGFLPRTERWNVLVAQLGSIYAAAQPVSSIANQTLRNVRSSYESLCNDPVVRDVFLFLVRLARACRFSDAKAELNRSGIQVPDEPTLLSIIRSLRQHVPPTQISSEYAQLAIAAAADALSQWDEENATRQPPLFRPSEDFFDGWRSLGDGSGFCELSRLFFAKSTERYLILGARFSETLPRYLEIDRRGQGRSSHGGRFRQGG